MEREIIELKQKFKSLEFTGTDEQWLAINLIINYCYYDKKANKDLLKSLLDKITNYCIEQNDKTFGFYIKCLIGAKTLKEYKIPINDLIGKAKAINSEYEQVYKELEV